MLHIVDRILNATTMYRLIVYYLGGLLAVATTFSFFGVLPHNPLELMASTAFLVALCWAINALFAYAWEVPTNTESSLITALILALIITPGSPYENALFLTWAAVLAMASKYLLTLGKRHIFNPAALAVAITAIALGQSATWWIGGNMTMLPFVLVGGLLIVRKLRRFDLVLAFILAALASSLITATWTPDGVGSMLYRALSHSPLLFFAFVMITEPLTTPPNRRLRIVYGALVGALFAPWVHLGSIYSTPELALLVGNIFSFAVSPRLKALLILREVRTIAANTYEYVFESLTHRFTPGQYAEFTLAADSSDTRGNRRYFTISSSPSESALSIGVKFYEPSSTFKSGLAELRPGDSVLAGALAGDFTLPPDTARPVALIAGGIGVTPFRSMIKHQLDTRTHRDVVLLYANRTESEIAYRDIFDAATSAAIGFRAHYTLTGSDIPTEWKGGRGFVDARMIAAQIPDYRERLFYISGPHRMVTDFTTTLRAMGVPYHHIHTDFIPGFA